jgi:hypothetical protein
LVEQEEPIKSRIGNPGSLEGSDVNAGIEKKPV